MYEYKCKLIRVIDADSVVGSLDLGFNVVLSNVSIRFYGHKKKQWAKYAYS